MFLLLHTAGFSQFVQSSQIEIPLSREDGQFEVIPAEKDGLFLYRRVFSNDGEKLHLVKFDTAFAVNWEGFLPVNSRFELMGKRSFANKTYLLFRHREIARKDLELVILENGTGNFVKHNVRNFIPFIPSEFQVTSHGVIIGGYFNNVPVVMFYSLSTRMTKVLPGIFNEPGELTQIQTSPTGEFEVLISAKNTLRAKTIWVKSYDTEGNLLYQIPLETDDKKHLLFARSIKTENGLHFVAGTYGTSRASEYSKGVFIARLDPDGMQQIRYYNYGDLQNFFKYMKVKREQRVKERIATRRVKGKKVRFNYRFLVHEIVPYNDQFVVLGEAFYAKYVTVERSMYGGFFNPIYRGMPVRNGRIFDGFYYTHAVVMGFDNNGKILWDNSFEINDVKTYGLEQFVKLEMQPDRIALLYLYDNKLRSKIIQGNEVLEGKTYHPLQKRGSLAFAKNEKNRSARLNYWYDDFFYAFGIREISNGVTSQKVFFLSKINYDENSGE